MTWGFQYVLHLNPICTVKPVVLDAVEMDLCHTNGSLPGSPGESRGVHKEAIFNSKSCDLLQVHVSMCVHPFQR